MEGHSLWSKPKVSPKCGQGSPLILKASILFLLCGVSEGFVTVARSAFRSYAMGTVVVKTTEKHLAPKSYHPVLASYLALGLRGSLWFLSGFAPVKGLNIQCRAQSNRAVLLGEFDHFSIEFEKLIGSLVKVSSFALRGDSLRLGAAPALIAAAPLLIPLLSFSIRQGGIFSLALIWFGAGWLPKSRKSSVSYRLCLNATDLEAPFFKWGLGRIANALLRGSALGVALATASAASAASGAAPSDSSGRPGPEDFAEATSISVTGVALDGNPSGRDRERRGPTATLRVVLSLVACFPDAARSQLAFTLRTALRAGRGANLEAPIGASELVFEDPELKLTLGDGSVRMLGLRLTLPDVWVPVAGAAAVLPLGSRHRLTRVGPASTAAEERTTVSASPSGATSTCASTCALCVEGQLFTHEDQPELLGRDLGMFTASDAFRQSRSLPTSFSNPTLT